MNDPSVTQQADNWCASCKTPFAEGEKVRQLPHCEHFVHEHCCPVEAGRCSIDAQLLDLSNLANHQPFPFSEPEYSRYDRLVDNMFQSHNCRNIAWIHSQLQNYEEAVRWLRRALRKKPDNPNAMMDLAECYQYGHGVARNTAKATQLREEAQPIIDQLNRQNATFLQLNPRTTPDTTADENTLQSHSSSIEKQERNGGKKSCENIHASTDSENEPTFTRSVNDGCHSLDESSCRQVHGNVLNNTTGIAPRLGDTHVDPHPSDSFENENKSPQSAGKSSTIVEQQTSIGINTVPSDQEPAETVLGPIEQSTEQAARFQGDDDSDQEQTQVPSDNTVMPGAEAEVWEHSQDDASQKTPETSEEEDESSSDIDIGSIDMFPSFANNNRSSPSTTSSTSTETYSITGWGLRNKLYRLMTNGSK